MTEPARPNPDALLAAIQRQEAARQQGRLKVFLGMSPGVGKTYAMLEAARREQAAGRDVVIGYVETHQRKETDALEQGLPIIPRRPVEYRGVAFSEMDLDAILARRPQLVLVDEFAHTNAPGSRHPKRYQDVMELLAAGIDVHTTLNIQHVESRAEAVRQITTAAIRETVPDTALDKAEFELVDLTPEELRTRLAAGKVYLGQAAQAAQENFFRPGNLSALRELVLRFAAEHVGQDVLAYRQAAGIGDPWKSGQRLLVAVGSSPTSAALVRWTKRLAGELQAPWFAVYVELPQLLNTEQAARLAKNLALARELGGQIIHTTDAEVARGILRVAREQNATQLVVGKPAGWSVLDWMGRSLLQKLIRQSGNIDVHAVRAEGESSPFRRPEWPRFDSTTLKGYWVAVGVVAGVSGLNALLKHQLGYQSLALVYLLSVVVLAMFVGRGPTLLGATLTAFLWDFLFVPPVFTFRITETTDLILFLTYFVVALAMGHLAARLRAEQTAERRREYRATALYLLTRELANATDFTDLLAIIIREVGKTFQAEVAINLPDDSAPGGLTGYFASTWTMNDKEEGVADWAFRREQPAGHGTDTLPSAEGLHLPLMVTDRVTGVLSLRFKQAAELDSAQRDLLDAFVRQIALVLDRQRLRATVQEAKLLAESERLSKVLLNSISHELRTPIAAIASASSGLGELADHENPELQRALTGEIRMAALRLNRLVGNLLDMTRLESGHMKLRLEWCDLADVAGVALRQLEKELARHPVNNQLPAGLPLVKIDFVLLEQVLVNLLFNAAVHTPPGTRIQISAQTGDKEISLTVADNGPGIPPEALPHLFDKFYRAPGAVAGGSGLGLSIVKGFVEAHGGTVSAENRASGGAEFTIRLPLNEAPPSPEAVL
jgi:two-component system sensor histidine kinase KdpD